MFHVEQSCEPKGVPDGESAGTTLREQAFNGRDLDAGLKTCGDVPRGTSSRRLAKWRGAVGACATTRAFSSRRELGAGGDSGPRSAPATPSLGSCVSLGDQLCQTRG